MSIEKPFPTCLRVKFCLSTGLFEECLWRYASNPTGLIDPWGWFCGVSQGHRRIPEFLGGNQKQNLITLAKNPRVGFHSQLNSNLKDLFGIRGGEPGGGVAD